MLSQKIVSDFSDVLIKFQETQKTATHRVRQFPLKTQIKSNARLLMTLNEKRINQLFNWFQNPFYANDEYNFESTTLSFKEETLGQTQEQMEEAVERDRIKLAEEQNQSIRQLESNIVDVNQIFRDLATIVHDQQGMFDNIERHIEDTHVRVETGNQQLKSAAEYQVIDWNIHLFQTFSSFKTQLSSQMKARKKRLMIVIIFAIILIILTIIIYFSVNH